MTPYRLRALMLAPLPDEQARDLRVTVSSGPVQRRRAVRFGVVDPRVLLQQQADGAGFALSDGADQRQIGRSACSGNRKRDGGQEGKPVLRHHDVDYHKINRMLKIPNFEYSLKKTVSVSMHSACVVGVPAAYSSLWFWRRPPWPPAVTARWPRNRRPRRRRIVHLFRHTASPATADACIAAISCSRGSIRRARRRTRRPGRRLFASFGSA